MCALQTTKCMTTLSSKDCESMKTHANQDYCQSSAYCCRFGKERTHWLSDHFVIREYIRMSLSFQNRAFGGLGGLSQLFLATES
jgi:hypothetical protein